MKCLYQIADHDVYRFPMPVIESNMYLIPAGNSCLVIDPVVSVEAERLLRKLCIQECIVLLTHEHYDHISGVNWLRGLLPCKVICSEACAQRIDNPRRNSAAYFDVMFLERESNERRRIRKATDPEYTCRADLTYSVQTELNWADLTITLTETPGHSPGSQIFDVNGRWYFTGDSLIPGRAVITRLPGGNKKSFEMITRPYIDAIASGSIIFPGHGEETPMFRIESKMGETT